MVDADRLARPVVDELDLGLLHQHRLVGRLHHVLRDAGRAHHLLRRNAVGALGPRPHELDAAARDDEGLELVGAQIGQQLEHRLIDEIGVGPLEARMARRGDPLEHGLPEFLGGEAGVRGRHDLEHALLAHQGELGAVVGQHRAERLVVRHSGWRADHRLDAIHGEDGLEIHRLLGPQRAVIVEGGDALGHGHPVAAAGRRGARHEIDDRLLVRAVVPRRQRIALRPRRRRGQRDRRCDDTADERSTSALPLLAAAQP